MGGEVTWGGDGEGRGRGERCGCEFSGEDSPGLNHRSHARCSYSEKAGSRVRIQFYEWAIWVSSTQVLHYLCIINHTYKGKNNQRSPLMLNMFVPNSHIRLWTCYSKANTLIIHLQHLQGNCSYRRCICLSHHPFPSLSFPFPSLSFFIFLITKNKFLIKRILKITQICKFRKHTTQLESQVCAEYSRSSKSSITQQLGPSRYVTHCTAEGGWPPGSSVNTGVKTEMATSSRDLSVRAV